MGKEQAASSSMWSQLFQFGVYKRSQGAVTRQVTFASLAVLFAIAALRMYQVWGSFPKWWQNAMGDSTRWVFSSVLLLFGCGSVFDL